MVQNSKKELVVCTIMEGDTLRKIIIREGQFVVTNNVAEISTILGSCIAVCLWDRETKIGGMNHYLLPGDLEMLNNPSRGFSATKMLVKIMLRHGACIENMEAKVFGGAQSLFQKNKFSVGSENLKAALYVLDEYEIPVIENDTGGTVGRNIYFNTETGKVRVKTLNKTVFPDKR